MQLQMGSHEACGKAGRHVKKQMESQRAIRYAQKPGRYVKKQVSGHEASGYAGM